MERLAAWTRKYAREAAPWRGVGDATFAARHLERAPAGILLDLGAGGGKTHAALVSALPERRILALDWVRTALRGSREPLVADATRLPVHRGSIAGVLASHVLGALDAVGREGAGTAIADALAPGGVAVVVDFARGDMRDGVGERVEDGSFVREGLLAHYFEPAALPALLPGLALVDAAVVSQPTRFAGPRRRFYAAFARV